MFDGIKKLWKGIMRMFGYTTLKRIIGKDIALSNDMIDAINRWRQMLNGDADWISDSIVSLGLKMESAESLRTVRWWKWKPA